MNRKELFEARSILEEIAAEEKIEGVKERMDQAFKNYCIVHPDCDACHAFEYSIHQAMMYIQVQIILKDDAKMDDDYQMEERQC